MNFKNQITVISLLFILSFLFLRMFFYGIKRHCLNNSAYKKRKKGETFLEWLFYSRYKKEIPRILRIHYILVVLIHLFCFMFCALLYIVHRPTLAGDIAARIVFWFDVIWILIIALLFSGSKPGFIYERWITPKNRHSSGRKPTKKTQKQQ